MYQYKATVIKVVDGDTIDCQVDLGFCIYVKERFRFAYINSPETSTEEGAKVKQIMTDKLLNQTVTLNVIGKDKYGRWLAEIHLADLNINQWELNNGYALPYKD